MICVVRVGQHAGNQAVNGGKPLDNFEPVMLVNGEAHQFVSTFSVTFLVQALPQLSPWLNSVTTLLLLSHFVK